MGCVCFRYLHLAYSTPAVQLYTQQLPHTALVAQAAALFVALVLLKIIIGVGLVFYAAGAHKRDAAVFLRTPAMSKGNENKISSGSGTGTFHNTVSSQPPATAPATSGASISRQSSLQQESADEHRFAAPPILPRGVTAGIAVTPEHTKQHSADHSTRPRMDASTHSDAHSHTCSSIHTPLQNVRLRSYSVSNPFTEIHVTAEDVLSLVATVGVDGAEEFIENQVENQQQYVADSVNIVPNLSTNIESEERDEAHLLSADSLTPPSSPARPAIVPPTASRSRPPLGKLNLAAATAHSGSHPQTSSTEQAGDLSEHNMVSPPMSPLHRSSASSVVGGGGGGESYHFQSPTPAATTVTATTSTPLVQLGRLAVRSDSMPDGDHSDNEDIMSDVSRTTTLEEVEAQRMKERLEFMEELSSIERYTVYKGRIL